MPSRTQIVCLHEGKKGRSIDGVFINRLIRSLNPSWIRRSGSNMVRLVPRGGRSDVISALPSELTAALNAGGHTTLMVWADMDDDMDDGEALKRAFWSKAEQEGITRDQFDQVVFVFAKDRLENWVEFLLAGATDEATEGPRLRSSSEAKSAACSLAERCSQGEQIPEMPPSLQWSCRNWRALVARMA